MDFSGARRPAGEAGNIAAVIPAYNVPIGKNHEFKNPSDLFPKPNP